VKALSCANGSVQWNHVTNKEAALPTVGLESMFATAAIDAKENRKVVTIDIPGAFIHATNKDNVVMQMNRMLAKLMAKTDQKLYQKYLTDIKGKCYTCTFKGLLWDDEECIIFLQETDIRAERDGFQSRPIQSLHSQQDSEREPDDNLMACG
jgi:hypothetical protein